MVTVKSTTVTLAHSSGVKCGLGRRVVQKSLKLSVKSTCKQPNKSPDRRQHTLYFVGSAINTSYELG
jgi:hypothetical protein